MFILMGVYYLLAFIMDLRRVIPPHRDSLASDLSHTTYSEESVEAFVRFAPCFFVMGFGQHPL